MSDIKKQSIETLIKAVLLAQGKGVYSLKDASLLYQCVASLTSEKKDIEEVNAVEALCQGALLGQKGGAYSLEDANSIFNSIKFLEKKKQKLDTITEVDEYDQATSSKQT